MIRRAERYREILMVLAHHGIGVVEGRLIKHEERDQARAEHLRLACEELGPMFIKRAGGCANGALSSIPLGAGPVFRLGVGP